MKLIKPLILLLFIVHFNATHAQPKPYKATAAQITTLKKQAEDMCAAMMKQDFKKLAYYTYPAVVQAMGGEDKMVAKLTGSMGQMQAQGITFKSVTVGDIKELYKSKGDMYSIVPNIIQISMNGTIITKASMMLAISHNNGVRWYFIDTAPLRHQNIKKMFPTYPDGLVIPETGGNGIGM